MAFPQRKTFKQRIHDHGALPNVDVFIDFLHLMLTLDPTKRASCQDLLAHEWLSL
jgi:serine/threonine-protein kinase SRPK3